MAEGRKQNAAGNTAIAKLPANDELILFDRQRAVIRSLGDSLAVASDEERQALVASLVCAGVAPPDGLEPPTPTTLDWYAEAG